MAFKIKQNDTLPELPFQIFEPDGTTPLDLTDVSDIFLCVRTRGDLRQIFKNGCIIDSPRSGLAHYEWASADTALAGEFQYEFEINWIDGNIQTVPVDGYLDLLIIDDIS